jgi:MSHA biogenesis protein MshJ
MKVLREGMQKIDALSPRERIILFILLLAGIWALMDALLLAPTEAARTLEQQKLVAAREQLEVAEDLLNLHASQPDPLLAARQRLSNVRADLDARMQASSLLQARMVAPRDRASVLQDILAGQPGLRLVSLDTLAPEPVGVPEPDHARPTQQAPAVQTAQPPPAALYRHGVKLTLVGNYAALTRYMTRLERLPVGFYWARAELDAHAHPEISLTLILFTLSQEATWLTV